MHEKKRSARGAHVLTALLAGALTFAFVLPAEAGGVNLGNLRSFVLAILDDVGLVDSSGTNAAALGPSSSVDSYVSVFSGTSGKLLDDRPVTVASTGQVSWPTGLGAIDHVLGPTDANLVIEAPSGRAVQFNGGGANGWTVDSSGVLRPAGTDNSRDLGTSSTRVANGYFGTTLGLYNGTTTKIRAALSGGNGVLDLDSNGHIRVSAGSDATSTKDTGIRRNSAGVWEATNGTSALYTLPGVLTKSATSASTGANTDETTLWSYSLPAGTLASDAQGVRIRVFGITASNTNSKTIRLYFGSATVRTLTTTTSTDQFSFDCLVMRSGATTQVSIADGTIGNLTRASLATPAETLSGAVTISCTGQNGTANAGDITFRGAIVEFLP